MVFRVGHTHMDIASFGSGRLAGYMKMGCGHWPIPLLEPATVQVVSISSFIPLLLVNTTLANTPSGKPCLDALTACQHINLTLLRHLQRPPGFHVAKLDVGPFSKMTNRPFYILFSPTFFLHYYMTIDHIHAYMRTLGLRRQFASWPHLIFPDSQHNVAQCRPRSSVFITYHVSEDSFRSCILIEANVAS